MHELLEALDKVLADYPEKQKPSVEVSNTVYRLLIKTEKKKAYESLVTI